MGKPLATLFSKLKKLVIDGEKSQKLIKNITEYAISNSPSELTQIMKNYHAETKIRNDIDFIMMNYPSLNASFTSQIQVIFS